MVLLAYTNVVGYFTASISRNIILIWCHLEGLLGSLRGHQVKSSSLHSVGQDSAEEELGRSYSPKKRPPHLNEAVNDPHRKEVT